MQYWLSLVFDLTGVLGGINTVSEFAFDEEPDALFEDEAALAALELCVVAFDDAASLFFGVPLDSWPDLLRVLPLLVCIACEFEDSVNDSDEEDAAEEDELEQEDDESGDFCCCCLLITLSAGGLLPGVVFVFVERASLCLLDVVEVLVESSNINCLGFWPVDGWCWDGAVVFCLEPNN